MERQRRRGSQSSPEGIKRAVRLQQLTSFTAPLTIFGLLVVFILLASTHGWTLQVRPRQVNASPVAEVSTPEEFVGPFGSWINVKTTYGAKGDGTTDDAAAIQRGLNQLQSSTGSRVLYFPAGTYKIASTLRLAHTIHVSIVGESPQNTVIKWAGPKDGVMLHINGVAYSRFDRLTFNGGGVALVAVDQSWDGGAPHFDTGNQYADDTFQDVGIGIRGGNLGHGFAETTVLRSRFLRNSRFGILLRNFNALDVWIWYSLFDHCGVGVSNDPGAGNFHVFNSVFRSSSTADMSIGNTGGFNIMNNTSTRSKAFLTAAGTSNPAFLTLQRNTIIDPTATVPIRVGNQGPFLLIDNTIRSPVGAVGPVIQHLSFLNENTTAVGNTFTVSNAIRSRTLIQQDTRTVSRDSLLTLTEPALPATPRKFYRTIIEVAPAATTATIQRALDTAAARAGSRPVVHLPAGTYKIAATLRIAANSDVQLIGDGGQSTLSWAGTGSGPVLRLVGPSKATVRDLRVEGNGIADGILLDRADQQGGRVYLEQVRLSNNIATALWADRLDFTMLDVRNLDHAYMRSGTSVKVTGGAVASTGGLVPGKATIYSCASSNNYLSYDVSSGGKLLVRSCWYETATRTGFARAAGRATLTVHGNRIAVPALGAVPAIDLADLNGRASILENLLDDRIVVRGDGRAASLLALGMIGSIDNYFINTSVPLAHAVLLNSRQLSVLGSKQIPNRGTVTPQFVRDMLAHTRAEQPQIPQPTAPGCTDVFMSRVWVGTAKNGVHITGS